MNSGSLLKNQYEEFYTNLDTSLCVNIKDFSVYYKTRVICNPIYSCYKAYKEHIDKTGNNCSFFIAKVYKTDIIEKYKNEYFEMLWTLQYLYSKCMITGNQDKNKTFNDLICYIPIVEIIQNYKTIILFINYMETNLRKYLTIQKNLENLADILNNIFKGLEFFNELGYAHLKLTLDNIFVVENSNHEKKIVFGGIRYIKKIGTKIYNKEGWLLNLNKEFIENEKITSEHNLISYKHLAQELIKLVENNNSDLISKIHKMLQYHISEIDKRDSNGKIILKFKWLKNALLPTKENFVLEENFTIIKTIKENRVFIVEYFLNKHKYRLIQIPYLADLCVELEKLKELSKNINKKEVNLVFRLIEHYISKNKEFYYLLEENIEGISLSEYIENNKKTMVMYGKEFTEFEIRKILRAILLLLKELHSANFTHNFLSEENIFIEKFEKSDIRAYIMDPGSYNRFIYTKKNYKRNSILEEEKNLLNKKICYDLLEFVKIAKVIYSQFPEYFKENCIVFVELKEIKEKIQENKVNSASQIISHNLIEPYKLKYEQYKIGDTLGRGTYGYIYECYNSKNPTTKYAMKIFNHNNSAEQILNEIENMRKLCQSENIVKFIDNYDYNGISYLIMEIMNDNLYSRIYSENNNPLTNKEIKLIVKSIGNAILNMHTMKIFDMDIKPMNILISYENPKDENDKNELKSIKTVKITDIDTFNGTDYYKPPKINNYDYLIIPDYFKKFCGIWSFGVTLAEVVFGDKTPLDAKKSIQKKNYKKCIENTKFSENQYYLQKFISKCFNIPPLRINEIMGNIYLKKINIEIKTKNLNNLEKFKEISIGYLEKFNFDFKIHYTNERIEKNKEFFNCLIYEINNCNTQQKLQKKIMKIYKNYESKFDFIILTCQEYLTMLSEYIIENLYENNQFPLFYANNQTSTKFHIIENTDIFKANSNKIKRIPCVIFYFINYKNCEKSSNFSQNLMKFISFFNKYYFKPYNMNLKNIEILNLSDFSKSDFTNKIINKIFQKLS